MQGHVGRKTLLQQNPSVLNWGCRLMQVVLYYGCKTAVVVVMVVHGSETATVKFKDFTDE